MTGFWQRLFGVDASGEGLRFWEIIAIVCFLSGSLIIGIYGASVGSLRSFCILELLAGAAWGGGSVLGFLFGVPRLRTAPGAAPLAGGAPQFTPNTNLEQISDWLTKIIVGATLVSLDSVVTRIALVAHAIGESIGQPNAAPASAAVMVFFSAGGFMWGYLWCSIRIFREMLRVIGEMPVAAANPN